MHVRITLDLTHDLMSCSDKAGENACWSSAHPFRLRIRLLAKALCCSKARCLVFVLLAVPINCGVDSVRPASAPSMELHLRLMESAMDC